MKCPTCQVNLVMTDRSGIEIDYCPECRGVWLDRGELDKIIERSAPAASITQPTAARPVSMDRDYRYDKDHVRGDSYKRKPKSVLGQIFDF